MQFPRRHQRDIERLSKSFLAPGREQLRTTALHCGPKSMTVSVVILRDHPPRKKHNFLRSPLRPVALFACNPTNRDPQHQRELGRIGSL